MVGYLDNDLRVAGGLNGYPLLGPVSSLAEVLHRRVVDEVVVCLPLSAWEKIRGVMPPVRRRASTCACRWTFWRPKWLAAAWGSLRACLW